MENLVCNVRDASQRQASILLLVQSYKGDTSPMLVYALRELDGIDLGDTVMPTVPSNRDDIYAIYIAPKPKDADNIFFRIMADVTSQFGTDTKSELEPDPALVAFFDKVLKM